MNSELNLQNSIFQIQTSQNYTQVIICIKSSCLIEIKNTRYTTKVADLTLPSNCDQLVNQGIYQAFGGNNCDFSQPIIIKYSSKTYISKVFVQSYQWYLQNCPQTLNTFVSVNSAQQIQQTLSNDSHEFDSFGMCDFRNNIIQIDSINSQSIEINYILNQTKSIGKNCLEWFVVMIQTCPKNCSSCNSSLNCLTCIDYYYLYSDKTCKTCLTQQGYYISGKNCFACNSTCQTCSGSQSNNCLSCNQGYFFFDDNYCKQSCDTQNGFAINNTNYQTCNTCKIDSGFYISGINCLSCHNTCKSCSGSQYNNCLSCYSGSYLLDDNTCSQSCDIQSGFFIVNQNCKTCDSSCKTCQGKKEYCLSCFKDKYLFLDNSCNTCQLDQGFYISGKNCFACNSFYISGINCLSCHNTCKSCSGSQYNNCLSCYSGSYLLDDNTCSQSCDIQSGFFIVSQNCKTCDSSCKTCQGKKEYCLSCFKDKYLFLDNSCNTCQLDQGFYISGINCLTCHKTCKSCSGSQNNNCLSCYSGSYIFEDNTCSQYCDIQNELFILGQNCNQCDSTCKTCQGNKDYCLSCKDGYSLKNNKCEQIYFSYDSKSFDQQQAKNLEQNMQATSSSISIGTSFISVLQNILFKQSQGILVSGFLYQKFSFLLILKTILPLPVYKSVTSLKEQFPTQQFQFLNIFKEILHLHYDEYQNQGFEVANISFNVLITTGPFITVLIICFFAFLSFNFLIDYFIDSKIQKVSIVIYSRLICGIAFQYFQIGFMVLIIGINQQIKFIFYYFCLNNIGVQASIVIILNTICVLIFLILYMNINDPKIIQKNTLFSQINRVSILNGLIFESQMVQSLSLK
ncbi:hypothetical protein ABPG72_003941 [Tetrahymena utriculariae]